MKTVSSYIKDVVKSMSKRTSGTITQKDRDYLEIVCKRLSCTLQELTDAMMHKSVLDELSRELEKVK